MITLTRLNGAKMLVNDDLILTVERTPDTMLHMVNGERLTVQESPEDLLKLVMAFRRQIGLHGVGRSPNPETTKE